MATKFKENEKKKFDPDYKKGFAFFIQEKWYLKNFQSFKKAAKEMPFKYYATDSRPLCSQHCTFTIMD